MDAQEVQHAVEELEPQVERLKALYQQYFMGIEKVPPSVLRKNVDRVIWQLRRERFQSTRLRFKFQQIIQRYNTYEQYWSRVLRQIENGTYKRDVQRAAKIGAAPEREADTLPPKEQAVWQLEHDTTAGWDQHTNTYDDEPTPPSLVFPQAAAQAHGQPAAQARAPAAWPLASQPAAGAPGFPGAQGPGPAPGAPPPRASANQSGQYAAQPGPPPPRAAPANQSGQYAAQPGPPPPRAAPANQSGQYAAQPGPPQPGPSAPRFPVAGQPAPVLSIGVPSAAGGVGQPPRRPPPPRPAATSSASAAAGLSEERTRQIYSDYVEAKRRAGESTAGLTYERLAKSLRDQTEKLRGQHPNRSLDYEVTTKDGKAVIRPVVK